MTRLRINSSTLTKEWSELCGGLTSHQTALLLRRLTSGITSLCTDGSKNFGDSYFKFLEKGVAYDILEGKRLLKSQNLTCSNTLNSLHRKIVELNQKSLLEPRDLSLSINAYAKLYENIKSGNKNREMDKSVAGEQLKKKALQLVDIASTKIDSMNEQDVSLVLNSLSKLNIKTGEIYNSTNEMLLRSLENYQREHEAQGESDSDNFLRNMTPFAVSLIMNAYAKSEVPINRRVLNYFVETYIPKMAWKFETHHLILTLNSLLKLKVPVNKIYGVLYTSEIILENKKEEFNMKLLSTALYTLGKYKYYPKMAIESMVGYLLSEDLSNCTELEISNVYYGLANLNIRNEELLEKMNEVVEENLKNYTPQGVVEIFHSMAKLDHNPFKIQKSKGRGTVGEEFVREFIKFYREDSLVKSFHRSTKLEVIPIHPINFCFSCAINRVSEPRLYNLLLNKLSKMIESKEGEYSVFKRESFLSNYVEEMGNNNEFKFLSKNIGIKGVKQLYYILQHVLNYVEGGLNKIDYKIMYSLNNLFDKFSGMTKEGKIKFEKRIKMSEYLEENWRRTVEETDLSTSKVHRQVYSSLQNILKLENQECEEKAEGESWKTEVKGQNQILYKEHEAIPYVVDIVIFKF